MECSSDENLKEIAEIKVIKLNMMNNVHITMKYLWLYVFLYCAMFQEMSNTSVSFLEFFTFNESKNVVEL
jgi:hypothetical protein